LLKKSGGTLDTRRQGEAVRQLTDCDAEFNEVDDASQANIKMQGYLVLLA